MIEIITTILSLIFVLFIPGLTVSLLFFQWKEIDMLERIALSIALSIAIVPLIVFYCNLIGIKISKVSVIMEILALLTIIGGILVAKEYISERRIETKAKSEKRTVL